MLSDNEASGSMGGVVVVSALSNLAALVVGSAVGNARFFRALDLEFQPGFVAGTTGAGSMVGYQWLGAR